MKYASISKLPWGKNIRTASGSALTPPMLFAAMPIAAERTEAFQARMKIAPAPKMNENRKDKNKTPMLFNKIFEKC